MSRPPHSNQSNELTLHLLHTIPNRLADIEATLLAYHRETELSNQLGWFHEVCCVVLCCAVLYYVVYCVEYSMMCFVNV